jgi:glycosyltransferase involved in cell wall biosynthesis
VFTGYVADDDLATLYGAADLFVYPSLFEGFGIPPLEAMASGCPVVTSSRSSLSEVAGDSAFLINPEDEWSITKGIAAVLTDESLRKELIRKGLARALKFSWEDSTRRLLAVYNSLA